MPPPHHTLSFRDCSRCIGGSMTGGDVRARRGSVPCTATAWWTAGTTPPSSSSRCVYVCARARVCSCVCVCVCLRACMFCRARARPSSHSTQIMRRSSLSLPSLSLSPISLSLPSLSLSPNPTPSPVHPHGPQLMFKKKPATVHRSALKPRLFTAAFLNHDGSGSGVNVHRRGQAT